MAESDHSSQILLFDSIISQWINSMSPNSGSASALLSDFGQDTSLLYASETPPTFPCLLYLDCKLLRTGTMAWSTLHLGQWKPPCVKLVVHVSALTFVSHPCTCPNAATQSHHLPERR